MEFDPGPYVIIPTRLVRSTIIGATRIITGLRANWVGCAPTTEQRIYFANHSSHGDFVLAWTALPPTLRTYTRPVAGADYWRQGPIRRFIGQKVFNAVLVERGQKGAGTERKDPIGPVREALETGVSLIIFPEGTRNMTDAPLLPFKSGIYYIAQAYPRVPLVPTWIDNVGRVLPKGEIFPVPLLCSVTFGEPIRLGKNEHKGAFLARAEQALLALGGATASLAKPGTTA
jgi:1-acyl-sn-glycerol-3-phosphate acyltransferase